MKKSLSFPVNAIASKLAIVATATLSLAVPATAATTYTWTQNSAATNAWTTSGNWDANGVPVSATDATVRIFADTTTALLDGTNTINLVPDLTLNVLTLNGKGAAATGPTNIIIGDNTATWTLDGTTPVVNLSGVNGTQALAYTVAVNLALNQNTTFTGNGTAGFTFSGVVSGAGTGITKSGTSNLILTGANTFTGGVTANAGTLTVAGASGAITTASSYTASGGTLSLDNTAGNVDRLNDALAVNLSAGGGLNLVGNATTGTTETIGTLGISTGNSTVTVASAAGLVTTLAASDFSRLNNATALIRGTSLNQTSATNVSRVTLADSGASLTLIGTNTLTGGGTGDTTQALKIVPYLIGDTTTSGNGSNFVTYDSTLGMRVLTTAEQTVLSAASTTSADPDNALAFNGTISSASDITLNSLLFNTASQTLNGSGGQLIVNSGAIAATANTEAIGSGFSGITLGNGTWNEGVITATSGNTLTVNAPINVTGGGGLTKGGAGTVVLAAANSYSGDTTINQGTLQIGSGSTTGSISGNVVNNATLSFNRSDAISYGGTISGTGAVTKAGAGSLSLSGASTYTGTTTVSAGTLQLASSSTGAITSGPVGKGTLALTGGALSSDSNTARSIANPITFGGNVTLGDTTNTGALTLSGAGTLTAARTITVNSNVTYSGNIGGAFGITKVGSGALTLTGNNTYTTFSLGSSTLAGGTLNFGSATALGSGAFTIAAGGGTFDNTSGSALTLTNSATVAFSGNFTFGGTNNLTFSGGASSGSTRTITLNGTGSVLTFLGHLRDSNNNGGNSNQTVNGAGNTLVIGGWDVGSGSGNSTRTLKGDGNITINGAIDDSFQTAGQSVVYAGTGVLTLNSASSNYRGSTTIQSGTLVANASAPTSGNGVFGSATGNIAVGNATSISTNLSPTLLIGNTSSIARALTVGSATTATTGVYTIGGSNTSGTAQFTGNVTMNQPVTLTAANGGTVDFNTGNWTTNNKAITVTGAGTSVVQLSHTLSTTAGISINSGSLKINGVSVTAPITVAGGTLMSSGGSLTISSAITLNSGFISPGDGATIGTLNATSLAWTGGHMVFNLSSLNNTSDQLALSGAFTAGGSGYTFDLTGGAIGQTYTLVTFASTTFTSGNQFSSTGVSGTFTLNGTNLQFTAIPEPSAYAVGICGMLAFLVVARKRRRMQS